MKERTYKETQKEGKKNEEKEGNRKRKGNKRSAEIKFAM